MSNKYATIDWENLDLYSIEPPESVDEAIELQNAMYENCDDKSWEIYFNHCWDDSDDVKIAYIKQELEDEDDD